MHANKDTLGRVRALLPLVLLAAACGRESHETVLDDAAVMGRARVLLVAGHRATVRVGNGPQGRIEAAIRYDGSRLERPVTITGKGGVVVVALAQALVGREGTELRVTAPPGLELQVEGQAGIEVSGSWERLVARTTGGAITAHVDRASSGALESATGAVEFVAREAGPVGDFTAKSVGGDVALRLPAGWRGRLHLSTQTGTLDVPPQPNLRTLWDENGKSVLAFVGPPLSEEDRAKELADKGSPTAVWASSAKGTVAFRLE
jgi:hypothetical protein